jgi:S-adenosylmethionine decarboxylase proenzyme
MGNHILLEIYNVDFNLLNELNPLLEIVNIAISKANMTVLNTYHHIFDPQGLTIVVCLEESHVSLHTFPEHNCVSIDAYTCGNGNPKKIALEFLKFFDSYEYQIRELNR